MKDLKNLLQKFQNLGLKEHTIKDTFIEIIKEDLNLELNRKQIELKENRLRILISGPTKTSIVLKKNFYLEELNSRIEELGTKVLDVN